MKITLTQKEAVDQLEKLLRERMGDLLANSTEFVVEIAELTRTEVLMRNFDYNAYVMMQRIFPDYKGSQKISAIKRLREMISGMGLADAKYAVESDLTTVEEYLIKNKTLVGFSNRLTANY